MRLSRSAALVSLVAATAGLPALAAVPGYLPVNHQRIVPLPPAEVWRRLHDFFEDQGMAVTSEDIKAGLIEASRAMKGRDSLHDLAQCPSRAFWSPAGTELELSTHVVGAPEGAKVTVNARFLENGKPGKKGVQSYACTSTGVLEAAVLEVASGQPMRGAVIPP